MRRLVMTQVEDTSREMRLDQDSFPHEYFEHAVSNHWDPYEDISREDIDTRAELLPVEERVNIEGASDVTSADD